MFTLTVLLVVGAAIVAALLIHNIWPKTEPTPTAVTVFLCALLFRTAAGIRESVAAGQVSRAAFDLESYALWTIFAVVLWLALALLYWRHECRAMVQASRALVTAAQQAQAARTPLDHRPGEDWEAEERHASP
jgi:hypothetical protein